MYRWLLAYRHDPNQTDADFLRAQFEQLFGQTTGYEQLDERLALTLASDRTVTHGAFPPRDSVHNNPAELGARQRVRKRDVSLQARTREGVRAWDTFQTLVDTGGLHLNWLKAHQYSACDFHLDWLKRTWNVTALNVPLAVETRAFSALLVVELEYLTRRKAF